MLIHPYVGWIERSKTQPDSNAGSIGSRASCLDANLRRYIHFEKSPKVWNTATGDLEASPLLSGDRESWSYVELNALISAESLKDTGKRQYLS